MIDPTFRKSSFSANNGCVSVADAGDMVLVMNSNQPEQGTLALDRTAMAGWLEGIKAGEFDDLS